MIFLPQTARPGAFYKSGALKRGGNEGNLAYRKVRVTDAFRMGAIRKFADRGKYWLPCKSKMLGATIDDVLDGYVTSDIEII